MNGATKILIVEDDAVLGDIITRKLTSAGYTVTLAKDGEEGLRAIKESTPDIVLLDIMMPKVNGYEFLEVVHKDPTLASIPVIILSNSGQPVEISRVMALGVKDYLVKAEFSPDEVLKKVQDALAKSQKSAGKNSPVRARILLVEDDSFLRDLMNRKLSQENGFEVSYATDGQEALDKVREAMPDIILLDLLLPTMDGYEVLRQLKEDAKLKVIPVLILSNLGRSEEVEKATKMGAAGFLIKSNFTIDEIISKIRGLLGTAK